MNCEQIWIGVLKKLQQNISLDRFTYNFFIQPLKPICKTEDKLVVLCPNIFTMNMIQARYQDHIEEAIKSLDVNLNLKLILEHEKSQYEVQVADFNASLLEKEKPILDPRFTFENFIVGENNELAHATATAIAKAPGMIYNPFFIYGKSGLGKTHLMQAIAHEVLKNDPTKRVRYVTSEQFTNELIYSIRSSARSDGLSNDASREFRMKYRNVDLLMIDDIQFLENKESTQEEFFNTFNELTSHQAQIVIASDKLPKDLKGLEYRLVNRFESGVVADIKPPNMETRIAILEKKASFEKYRIPSEVLNYIAENISTSIRELEGALKRVNAYSLLTNGEPSVEIASRVLSEMRIESKRHAVIEPETIIRRVARHYNCTFEDLIGKKRNENISFARHVAMYITRELTDLSYPTIGACFNRDHTSVIYAYNKLRESTEKNRELRKVTERLIKEIKKNNGRNF